MHKNITIDILDEAWLNDWIKSLMPPAASEEHAEGKAKFLQQLYALDDTTTIRSLDEVLIATKLEALAEYVQTHAYIHKDQEADFLSKLRNMRADHKKDAAVNSIDALEQLLHHEHTHAENQESMRDHVQSALATVDFTVCEEGISEALQRAALNLLTQGELLSVLYVLKVDFIEKQALQYLIDLDHPLTGLAGMQTHDVQSLKNAIADEYGLQKVENMHTAALSSFDAEYRERYINDWKKQLEASMQASFWPQAVQELFGWRPAGFRDMQAVDLAPGQALPPMEHVQSNTLFFQKDAAGNYRVLPYVHDAERKPAALNMQRNGIVMSDWYEENRWSEGITRHHILFKAKLYEYLAVNSIQVMASSTASQAYHEHYQQLLGLDDSEMSMCAEMLTVSKSMPWTGYFSYSHAEKNNYLSDQKKDAHVSKMAILSYAIARAISVQAKARKESVLDPRIAHCLNAWQRLKVSLSWTAYKKTPEQIKAYAADPELIETVEAYGLQQWYLAQCVDWGLSLSDMLGVAVQMREHAWSVDDKPKMLKWSERLAKNVIDGMMGEDMVTHMKDLVEFVGEGDLYTLALRQTTNALLEALVEKEINPNRIDDVVGTPLMDAITLCDYEKIQCLLKHPNIDVNTVIPRTDDRVSPLDRSALSLAALGADGKSVELLLNCSGIDIDKVYRHRTGYLTDGDLTLIEMLLMRVSKGLEYSQYSDIVQQFIEHGAKTYYEDRDIRDQPLIVAVKLQNQAIVDALLQRANYPEDAMAVAVHTAINVWSDLRDESEDTNTVQQSWGMVQLLMEQAYDPNKGIDGGDTLLQLAVKTGDVELVQALVNKGARLNEKYTPSLLAIASLHDSTNMVCALLRLGLQAENDPEFLVDAVVNLNISMVNLLLENGASVDSMSKGYTALLWALKKELMITFDYGYNGYKRIEEVNVEDKLYRIEQSRIDTTKQLACREIAKLLIEGGATTYFPDSDIWQQPLIAAVRLQNKEMVEAIVQSKSYPEDAMGAAVYIALGIMTLRNRLDETDAKQQSLEILEFLMQRAYNPNIETSQMGNNLLQLAVGSGDAELVKALIEKGASLGVTEGPSLLAIASFLGDINMGRVLLRCGLQAKDDSECLVRAVEKRYVDMVKFLLKEGASVDSVRKWEGYVVREKIADVGEIEEVVAPVEKTVLQMVLEDMKKFHNRDNATEKSACRDIAKLLIEQGAKTYTGADMSISPLHTVIEVCDAELSLMILKKEGYPYDYLQSTLPFAVQAVNKNDMFEVLKSLLAIKGEPKLDVLKEGPMRLCPLVIALRLRHAQAVDALLAYADIDEGAANTMESPILNDALEYQRLDVALYLLEKGVDPTWKGTGEQSALDVAKQTCQKSIETKKDLLQYLTTTLEQQLADGQINAHGLFSKPSGLDPGVNPTP